LEPFERSLKPPPTKYWNPLQIVVVATVHLGGLSKCTSGKKRQRDVLETLQIQERAERHQRAYGGASHQEKLEGGIDLTEAAFRVYGERDG
jgi:hypothetical protein